VDDADVLGRSLLRQRRIKGAPAGDPQADDLGQVKGVVESADPPAAARTNACP
jgi:hypothetical protein